jgi:hypothetical protein
MAIKRSKRALSGKKPTTTPAGAVTHDLLAAAEARIAMMQAFAQSEVWALQRKVLETASDRMRHEREGMLRSLGKPESPVTLEALMRLQGQIEENDKLIRFPRVTLDRWLNDVEQMREVLSRPGQT